jgi:APA family basic amino acid/polyamine antiporter
MAFSMARRNDLPGKLKQVHSRFGTPYFSILIIGIVMALLAFFVDLTGVVAVSTFALLFWYVLVNLSAFRLECEESLFPKWLPILGLITCSLLLLVVLFVSPFAWIVALISLIVGTIFYITKKSLKSKQE